MKFADILQSVGLGVNGRTGIELNATAPGRAVKGAGSEVDRLLHQGYKSYHAPSAYHQQMDLGLNPAIGSLYYPQAHNIFGQQRGFGLRLGGFGGHTHGSIGHPGGFGHSGYGGHVGGASGGGGGGGYDHSYSSGRQKSKGSSVMTALTLLSFFFFINLLQNCLKEHMDTMNPTVMVMTAGVARNRVNKLTEANSREIPASVNSDKDQLVHGGGQGDVWYMNSTTTSPRGVKIEPKLKNDYFRDGSTFYMRIN